MSEPGSADAEAERVARLFEKGGHPEFAERWRLLKSDAGVYLQEYHGLFRADFATLAEASEAGRVFGHVQRDLFWALGWSTSAGAHEAPSNFDDERRLTYLRRLSGEARADDEAAEAGRAGPVTRRIGSVDRSWSEQRILEAS